MSWRSSLLPKSSRRWTAMRLTTCRSWRRCFRRGQALHGLASCRQDLRHGHGHGQPPDARYGLLNYLRCDGSAHGGCQAGCRLYWKEAWLRRVDASEPAAPAAPPEPCPELDAVLEAGTHIVRD